MRRTFDMKPFKKIALSTVSAMALAASTQAFSAPGDWSTVGGDGSQSKYSALNQITPANVTSLTKAWSFEAGGGSLTPVAVNGVVYYPSGPKVFAIDGDTGKLIWETNLSTLIPITPGSQFNAARPPEFGQPQAGGGGRGATPPPAAAPTGPTYLAIGNSAKYGLAYWPGTGKVGPRLVLNTSGGYMIQLDAKTGQLIKNFGQNGALDLRVGVMEKINLSDYTPGALPTIYKNYAIVMPRTSENGRYGTPGDPRAFDLLTGKMVWRFHVVPHPGEANFGGWGINGWQDRRCCGSWVPMSVDTKNGIVFIATGNATDQDYGATRPGDNLYATSTLALEGDTGKLRWYHQNTHHDIYDWDVNAPPVLFTMKDKDGKMVDAVAQSTKQGYLFVLDRLTGKPILPVEEKRQPLLDTPGELPSPTQPVPAYPGGHIARVSLTRDEVANISPESHKFCLNIYDKVLQMGEGTAYQMVPSLVFPSSTGGPNTGGVTFDPASNTMFVNVQNLGTIAMLTPILSVGAFESLSKSKIPFVDQNGYPCSAPPWGELLAINAATGEFAWRQTLGEYKELTAKGVPPTGMIPAGGSIVTAGGVLFVGATQDKMFRAFDPKTGKLLWSTELPGAGGSTPLTFAGKSGKQYVGIITQGAGGGGGGRGAAAAPTGTGGAPGALEVFQAP
jgi:quinoprotein glucose dehydrogenase